jgi:hypothetical protein
MILAVLLPVTDRVGAAGPRQWDVTVSGPDRVAAGHDYVYPVTLTNDDGAWPSSPRVSTASARRSPLAGNPWADSEPCLEGIERERLLGVPQR